MEETLTRYINSSAYEQDLLATRILWTRQGILGMAGMFIFLSYITLPLLLQVEPVAGIARSATLKLGLLREQEKRFLQRLIGLSDETSWQGGIANIRIRSMLSGLRQRHLRFTNMHQEYIEFFAHLIALSPGRIYASTNVPIDDPARSAFWRYMTHAYTLLGVSLETEAIATQRCQHFIERHTQPTPEGKRMFKTLQSLFPGYTQQAIPAVFPATRLAIQRFQEDLQAHV